MIVYTIGHSNHELAELCGLLAGHGVTALADVRRWPGSKRHPQFSRAALQEALADRGWLYEWLGRELGGMVPQRDDGGSPSPNDGWESESLRRYADRIGVPEFEEGMQKLRALLVQRPTAVMCAEGDFRRCHRQILADVLDAAGFAVRHIDRSGAVTSHPRTSFAVVREGRLIYPRSELVQPGLFASAKD